jgi:hypothetical protein
MKKRLGLTLATIEQMHVVLYVGLFRIFELQEKFLICWSLWRF